MLTLRKFLRACYGYLAALFLFASIYSVPSFVRSYREDLRDAAMNPEIELWRAIVSESSRLVELIPLLLGIFFGLAWWTLRQGKPSGRTWALVASVISILTGFPLIVVLFFTIKYGRGLAPLSFLLLPAIPPVIGIAGLAAFARRNPDSLAVIAQPKPMRMRGDGTSGLFDALAWGIGVASGIAGVSWCYNWAFAHRLPNTSFRLWCLEFAGSILFSTTAHELGHASVGTVLGMKLRSFVVGPLQWRIRDGRWRFEFTLQRIFSAGGSAALVPVDPEQSKWIDIAMIAAGPLASLITGFVCLGLFFNAPGRFYESVWKLFSLCAVFSLSSVLVNLIPLRPGAIYSDGAQIYQLISGGPWADFRHAISVVQASTVTPLRPRDYDIAAIQRAASSFIHGYHALSLQLIASFYYIDIGDQHEAAAATARAERICQESSLDPAVETLPALAYGAAFLRRDAVAARDWWERLEAKKPTHLGVDYWLARSALLWVEGNLTEAREAWEKGNVLAQKLPAAGDYDFDRDRSAVLGRAINGALTSSLSETQAVLEPS